jgi:hypothetical protein
LHGENSIKSYFQLHRLIVQNALGFARKFLALRENAECLLELDFVVETMQGSSFVQQPNEFGHARFKNFGVLMCPFGYVGITGCLQPLFIFCLQLH